MNLPDSICRHMLKLKTSAKSMTLKRHDYLYLESDAADTVYMLEQGMVMLTKLLSDGHEVGIILLSGHNIFGQCEVLSSSHREHQAVALTQTKVWAVNAQDFLKETMVSSAFAIDLARLQNERLRHAEHHIRSVAQDNVTKRLATILVELAQNHGCDSVNNPRIQPCPTHQDLATMVSSTRETVSTIMNRFRKETLISFDRKQINILKQDSLRQL